MRTILMALALAFGFSGLALAASVDCEPARCAVQAAIAADCPCPGAENHGRYVSCVARTVNRLAANGTVPINCKGKVTRCAARSTCGKPGFLTCHIPTDDCLIPDGATSGTCADDPALQCTTDLDCGSRCKIRRTEELCVARGGTVGTENSCCASCNQ